MADPSNGDPETKAERGGLAPDRRVHALDGASGGVWSRAATGALATLADLGRFLAALARASAAIAGANLRGAGAWLGRRLRRDPTEVGASSGRKISPVAAVGYAIGGLVAVSAAGAFAFYLWVTWDMPSTRDLWVAPDRPSLTYYDRNGRVILREEPQNAPPVEIQTLPDYVPEAFIAIEDKKFYRHKGVDLEGLARAIRENLREGRVVQGGSTITQQLAKNIFLSNERTVRRKLQEAALAFRLEQQFTKNEILALYLSRVFFGAGAWGIESAAERYFDKPASELNLNEAALLAGLVKAPSKLNPVADDTAAKARALVVLNEMVRDGYITAEERDAARDAPLPIRRRNPVGNFGYFRDWIDQQLTEIIGERRDDFEVHTTLDLAAQREGERAVAMALTEQGEKLRVGQAALLSLDDSGGVRAMVGGEAYGQTQFNRATQARRQPGSAFKYFIYLTAMERENFSPWTIRVDEPITIGDWSPGNYDEKYAGPVTLGSAFALSLNMVAISLAHEVGGSNVIDRARRLGVETRLQDYRSLALGAQEMTLLEITRAYAAMSNDGARVDPHGIVRVAAGGRDLWAYKPPERERVISERARKSMNLLMTKVVQSGTGTRARIPGRDIGGKTGTGNDYRDAWFVGFTSGITTGVWVGNDDFRPTRGVTGGSMPAQIWRQYMEVALRDMPPRRLTMPNPADYPAEPPEPPLVVEGDPGITEGGGAPLIAVSTPPARDKDELPPLEGIR